MSAASLTICINSHQAYGKFIPAVIKAMSNQTEQPRKIFFAWDGPKDTIPQDIPESWEVIHGEYKNPCPLRNEAAKKARTSWITFIDGDDTPGPTFIEDTAAAIKKATKETGCIYGDLLYSTGQRYTVPEFDINKLRFRNFVSAASAWRRTAINKAGGFPEDTNCYDDYTLAIRLYYAGFTFEKGGQTILVNCHKSGHRRATAAITTGTPKQFPHVWLHRKYIMVTLFAGRTNLLGRYFTMLEQAKENGKLPPMFEIVAVDNSRNPEFTDLLRFNLARLEIPFKLIEDTTAPGPEHIDRHKHVAALYTRHLAGLDCCFVYMVEDDIVQKPDTLKQLARQWSFMDRPAGIGAVYLSRHNTRKKPRWNSKIVASNNRFYWAVDLTLEDVTRYKQLNQTKPLMKVRQIAGGATLWNNGIIQQCLPLQFGYRHPKSNPIGWDSDLSFKAGDLRANVFIHTGEMVDHRY